MKKTVIILAIALVVVAGIAIKLHDAGATVEVAHVAKGDIRASIEERARTTLPLTHRITMPLDGRVLPITVEEGDSVKAGQVVAQMDESELRIQLEEAEANLNAASARVSVSLYNEIEKTALIESDSLIRSITNAVGAAWKKVEASKAREEYAKWWVDQNKQIDDTVSKQVLKEAQSEYAQSNVDRQADEFIYYAMQAVAVATNLMPDYVNQWLERKTIDRNVLLYEQAAAQAVVDRVKHDLSLTRMTSSIDGVVLKRLIENERVLPAGELLLELGDLSAVEVTSDILSEEVGRIRLGNPVDVYGPALGADGISGAVDRIDPAGFTKLSSLGVEEQRVKVKVALNQEQLKTLRSEGHPLGVDYRVRVRVYTATHKDTMVIPRTSLFRGTGSNYETYVVRDGKAHLVPVEVGITNDSQAEILSGLDTGDVVIVAPDASLRDGDRVKVAEAE